MPREVVFSGDGPFAVKVGWAADRDVQIGVETDDGRSLAWVFWQNAAAELGRLVREPGWMERAIAEAQANAQAWDGLAGDRLVGEQILNWLDTMSGVPPENGGDGCYRGVWAFVGRADCNRLIKLLRKARDAAYGADA